MTVKANRSWLWISVVVLSGVCSGLTGLYTGSNLTALKYEQRVVDLRKTYEQRIAELQGDHKDEMARIDRDTGALLSAIDALTGKLGGVVSQVSEVSSKVDKAATTAAATHAEAKAAVQQSKLAAAKTDVLTAKVQEAQKAPRIVILKPASEVPASAPAPLSPQWWRGSTKHQ